MAHCLQGSSGIVSKVVDKKSKKRIIKSNHRIKSQIQIIITFRSALVVAGNQPDREATWLSTWRRTPRKSRIIL